MPFKEQIKRFALVPVEPGNEKDTDIEMRQDEEGDVIRMWPRKSYLYLEHDAEAIAALGFPTEGDGA